MFLSRFGTGLKRYRRYRDFHDNVDAVLSEKEKTPDVFSFPNINPFVVNLVGMDVFLGL